MKCALASQEAEARAEVIAREIAKPPKDKDEDADDDD